MITIEFNFIKISVYIVKYKRKMFYCSPLEEYLTSVASSLESSIADSAIKNSQQIPELFTYE